MTSIAKSVLSALVILICQHIVHAQVLSLKEAEDTALKNYNIIKAKSNYANASQSVIAQTKREALPNFVISAQQDYGTINGQNGPLYGFGGYGVASSGLPLPEQNWNAAFGALYLANINWEFFAFGRVKERVKVAASVFERDNMDLQQEQFQHQVKVAAAYLNLLAAQRISRSLQNNLNRADTFRFVVTTRAKNGLIAGVDSSLANAEVSAAKIALLRAQDAEQQKASELAVLMGTPDKLDFLLDTLFITKVPAIIGDSFAVKENHPVLAYYRSRIHVSEQQQKYTRTLQYPAFSLFSVYQTRGSGFHSNYATDQTAFDHKYYEGIKPVRSNYLVGVGVTWNLTTILRVHQQLTSQKFISEALRNEYNQMQQQLTAQQILAEAKLKNAVSVYTEAPVQVKAASDAYLQKSVLYKNGLTNIVDVTQALYALNRAETDRDIAYNNVWQALLLKAAAAGDFGLFINEL
ncbi:MAG: TolC family protein [Chitinophagaceae bacterium]|nr:TolC family protein [Chitinophagaceae bacterium]